MKKNKTEWRKVKETNYMYEINIKGQLRNIKSKKIKISHQNKLMVNINKEQIYLGTVPVVTWQYFKGEITHEMLLKGWYKLTKYFPDFPKDYFFVNEEGQLFNYITQRFIEWSINKYEKISFEHYGYKTIYKHILIARMHKPIPDKYKGLAFDDLEVHHIDEDKLNNNLDNLQWVTQDDHKRIHIEQLLEVSRNRIQPRDKITGKFISSK